MAFEDRIRVLSLNCWGIPYFTTKCDYRISCIGDELSKDRHDIIALQEIWIEDEYQSIKSKLANTFPHSHYFYSGSVGTGLCIFSKYPIVDAFLHQFSTNGEFYAILQGDWFAGKGAEPPQSDSHQEKFKPPHPHIFSIYPTPHPHLQSFYHCSGAHGSGMCVFSKFPISDTALYQYSSNGEFYALYFGDWYAGSCLGFLQIQHPKAQLSLFVTHLHADYASNPYTELRTLQAYECAQFIQKVTRPGETVILCGDFNHEDTEIGMRTIKLLTGLEDTFETAAERSPGPSPTCNTLDNPYRNKNEKRKRIDFIFHSSRLACLDHRLDMEKIPDSKHHFSDHKGVSATFKFKACVDPQEQKPVPNNANLRNTRLKTLHELQDTVKFGLKTAEEYKWNFIIPVWILLFTFIFMPVFSEDGLYVLIPILSQLSGEFVFLLQLSCIVISVSYFWMLVILKRMEQRAYKNALLEIQFKISCENNQTLHCSPS
eukprot:gene12773-14084_t